MRWAGVSCGMACIWPVKERGGILQCFDVVLQQSGGVLAGGVH